MLDRSSRLLSPAVAAAVSARWPDVGPVADETWYQTYGDAHRAIEWFVELCRDVVGVYAESHGFSPGSSAAG